MQSPGQGDSDLTLLHLRKDFQGLDTPPPHSCTRPAQLSGPTRKKGNGQDHLVTSVSPPQPHGHLISREEMEREMVGRKSLKKKPTLRSVLSGQPVFVVFHKVPFREGAWF